VSATTAQREAGDPFGRLAPAAARYLDAVGAAAESQVDTAVLHQIDTRADTVHPGLTAEAAWSVLRRHLAIIALVGGDPIGRLADAAARRELDTAADAAAVLDWCLDYSGAHSTGIGPLRWPPNIPGALQDHPVWREYLRPPRSGQRAGRRDPRRRQNMDAQRRTRVGAPAAGDESETHRGDRGVPRRSRCGRRGLPAHRSTAIPGAGTQNFSGCSRSLLSRSSGASRLASVAGTPSSTRSTPASGATSTGRRWRHG
jgi:hypothetical protein